MSLFINHIFTQPVSSFHQYIQILSAGMDVNPSRMVAGGRCVDAADQGESAVAGFLVCPDFVRPHVGRVQIRLRRVEDHAVDGGLFAVFVVLDVLVQLASFVNRKDVTVACMLVEWVAIDTIRRLLGC